MILATSPLATEQRERVRYHRSGECSHVFIDHTDDQVGVCRICGVVFTWKGLGVWEPVTPAQVVVR